MIQLNNIKHTFLYKRPKKNVHGFLEKFSYFGFSPNLNQSKIRNNLSLNVDKMRILLNLLRTHILYTTWPHTFTTHANPYVWILSGLFFLLLQIVFVVILGYSFTFSLFFIQAKKTPSIPLILLSVHGKLDKKILSKKKNLEYQSEKGYGIWILFF